MPMKYLPWYSCCGNFSIKAKLFPMKKLLTVIVILLTCVVAQAQPKDQVPLTKKERKLLREEEKKQYEKMMEQNTAAAINTGFFVLKADRVKGKGGVFIPVNPTINFIAVQGSEAYIQLGSDTGIGGNGLGGMTIRGNITDYNIQQDEKQGNYYIRFNTIGGAGTLTIHMRINKTGDISGATVTSNWGNSLDYAGVVVPLKGSRIYKGSETF